MNTPEIKAGQTWHRRTEAKTAEVKHVSDGYVFYIMFTGGKYPFANGITEREFVASYYLIPEPKTRPTTADDVMEMLAANPVLWRRLMSSATIFGDWELMTSTQFYPVAQYSHNPFAPNAKIVGPEIEVTE